MLVVSVPYFAPFTDSYVSPDFNEAQRYYATSPELRNGLEEGQPPPAHPYDNTGYINPADLYLTQDDNNAGYIQFATTMYDDDLLGQTANYPGGPISPHSLTSTTPVQTPSTLVVLGIESTDGAQQHSL